MSLYEALAGDYDPTSVGSNKLTADDACDIRELYRECGWSQKEIAVHFGISQPQVSRIVNHKQWKEAVRD